MLENSVYSVISPEGCASIMWRDPTKKDIAAQALRITAKDLTDLGCIDETVPEPPGGAHNDHASAAAFLSEVLLRHLNQLKGKPAAELLNSRYEKFRRMTQFFRES
jgi:acetyl-CoA carboxylase carboxyl transferase subunit alpha